MFSDDTNGQRTTDRSVRERYEEFDVGASRVAIISDPENESAWVLSDTTLDIVP